MMMWRRDDGIKLSRIEVDLQGDRCSTIIQGFREGCSDEGGEGEKKQHFSKDLLTVQEYVEENR